MDKDIPAGNTGIIHGKPAGTGRKTIYNTCLSVPADTGSKSLSGTGTCRYLPFTNLKLYHPKQVKNDHRLF
jgi:hypothetical protein